MTSISVHSSTVRMLQAFKRGDMTWDDVLINFIEEHVPAEFVKEMIRQSREEKNVPWFDSQGKRVEY